MKNDCDPKIQNQFLLHKSINQTRLAASRAKQEYYKQLLDVMSQIFDGSGDDEDIGNSPQ